MKNLLRFRSRKGNAMVEFALSVPFITLTFAGCFQFGYYFYIYDRLESAVRAGARYAALRSYDSSTSTPSDTFSTAVKNMVVYGTPSGGTASIVPGLTTSNVNLSVTWSNNTPYLMTVYISGFQVDALYKTFTMTGKPAATFRFGGKLSPSL